jgi:hypothetical protein
MRERMAGMSPEERQQMIERMKARGITLSTNAEPAAAVAPQRGQGQGQNVQRRPAPAAATQTRATGATTIDALFGPLPPTESFGQVWLHENGKLTRVRLRVGIADGQQTELIQVLDNNAKVDDGTDAVTSVTLPAARNAAAAGGNAFPGLGQQRGGFPGGGFPGQGGNRGGGGRGGGR